MASRAEKTGHPASCVPTLHRDCNGVVRGLDVGGSGVTVIVVIVVITVSVAVVRVGWLQGLLNLVQENARKVNASMRTVPESFVWRSASLADRSLFIHVALQPIS